MPDSNKPTVSGFFSSLYGTVKSAKYEHLLAGLSGGVTSTMLLHPLDLLKIRFAVDDGSTGRRPKYAGLFNAVRVIKEQEGLRGFYKGVTPNVVGAGTSWGLYFFIYQTFKTELQGGNSKLKLSPEVTMAASAGAGVVTLACTNPIWVVKTRLCLQYDTTPAGKAGASGQQIKTYKGMVDAFYQIGKYEGIRGLYKGFVPGLWGVSHGAVQFSMYEELRGVCCRYKDKPVDSELTTLESLFCGSISKLVAALVTYPIQVVRARLQDQRSDYAGAVDCVKKTFRGEGPRGFYKGLAPNLMRVVPATAITFVVYEKVSFFIRRLRNENAKRD